MFGQTMLQTVEKEAVQKRVEKEAELNHKIAKLQDELASVLSHATKLGHKYQSLSRSAKAKEERHNEEMEKMLQMLADNKGALKEERDKAGVAEIKA